MAHRPGPRGPIETKVAAGSFGALVAGALIFVLQTVVWPHAPVPEPVAALVDFVAPLLATALLGWLAPHTSRYAWITPAATSGEPRPAVAWPTSDVPPPPEPPPSPPDPGAA